MAFDLYSIKVIEADGRKVVVKRYKSVLSYAKWLVSLLPPVRLLYPFETDPLKRLNRELTFFTQPPPGVRTPGLVDVDMENLVLVREYVEGAIPGSSPAHGEALGRTLGLVHQGGYCMGDTKSSNFLLAGDEIYVIDAEQATSGCASTMYKAWDVAFHLFTHCLRMRTALVTVGADEYVSGFLRSYAEIAGPELDGLERAIEVWGFFAMLNPVCVAVVRKELASVKKI